MGMVDPATLPEMLPAPSAKNEAEGERKIDLSEIIGLPDFDVCPLSLQSPFQACLSPFFLISVRHPLRLSIDNTATPPVVMLSSEGGKEGVMLRINELIHRKRLDGISQLKHGHI